MGRVFLFIGMVCLVLAGPCLADGAGLVPPEGGGSAPLHRPWTSSPPRFLERVEDRALLVVRAYCGTGGKGQVIAALFDSATGFPRTPVRKLNVPVQQDGTAEIHFEDLVPGDYAVTVIDDEDMNGRLNRNFLGVPKELYGISNDVRPGLSSPKWEEAKFPVTAPRTDIAIRMKRYELVARK